MVKITLRKVEVAGSCKVPAPVDLRRAATRFHVKVRCRKARRTAQLPGSQERRGVGRREGKQKLQTCREKGGTSESRGSRSAEHRNNARADTAHNRKAPKKIR